MKLDLLLSSKSSEAEWEQVQSLEQNERVCGGNRQAAHKIKSQSNNSDVARRYE